MNGCVLKKYNVFIDRLIIKRIRHNSLNITSTQKGNKISLVFKPIRGNNRTKNQGVSYN